jgi:hypothetical protein
VLAQTRPGRMNDKPIPHSRGGASVEYASAATRLILLFGVCALLVGALLAAPGLLPSRQSQPAAETAKVGPTFSGKQPMSPAAQPLRAAASPAPAAPAAPPPSLSSVAANTAQASPLKAAPVAADPAPPPPKPAAAEPSDVASLSDDAEVVTPPPARPAKDEKIRPKRPERVASSARQPRCTTYRTYNAATQTYRSYDGVTRPCRAE